MVSITLSVPEEVRGTMKKFPEVNWSGLVRTCIIEKAKILNMKESLLKDLSKEKEFNDWAVDLGKRAKKGRLKSLSK
jgi:predicted NUDIX family NTP pyrophosphohydrolase